MPKVGNTGWHTETDRQLHVKCPFWHVTAFWPYVKMATTTQQVNADADIVVGCRCRCRCRCCCHLWSTHKYLQVSSSSCYSSNIQWQHTHAHAHAHTHMLSTFHASWRKLKLGLIANRRRKSLSLNGLYRHLHTNKHVGMLQLRCSTVKCPAPVYSPNGFILI